MLSGGQASENASVNRSPLQVDNDSNRIVFGERNVNFKDETEKQDDEMKEVVSFLMQSGYGWILNDGKHRIDDVNYLIHSLSNKENAHFMENQCPTFVDDDTSNIQQWVAINPENDISRPLDHLMQSSSSEEKSLQLDNCNSDFAVNQMKSGKAIIIQKHCRRYTRRKIYQRDKINIILLQNVFRQRSANKKLIEVKLAFRMQYLVSRSAIIIQTHWRSYRCRSFFRNQQRCSKYAKIIQSCIRGYHLRKKLQTHNIKALRVQKIFREYAMLEHHLSDLSNIIIVQSIYRQRKAKKRFDQLKLIRTLHHIVLQSAILIQSRWRSFYWKGQYLQYRSDLKNIILIQSFWRQRQAKKRCDKLKLINTIHHIVLQSAILIQRQWRSSYYYYNKKSCIQRQKYQSDLSNIILVQSLYRQRKASIKVDKLKLSFTMQQIVVQSAILIQKQWRSFYCKKNYFHVLKNVRAIQNQIRVWRSKDDAKKSTSFFSSDTQSQRKNGRKQAKTLLQKIQSTSPKVYQLLTVADTPGNLDNREENAEGPTPLEVIYVGDKRDDIEVNNPEARSETGRHASLVGDRKCSSSTSTNLEQTARNMLKETSHISQNDFASDDSEVQNAFTGIVKSYAATKLKEVIEDSREKHNPSRKVDSPQSMHGEMSKAKMQANNLLIQLQSLAPEVYQLLATENNCDSWPEADFDVENKSTSKMTNKIEENEDNENDQNSSETQSSVMNEIGHSGPGFSYPESKIKNTQKERNDRKHSAYFKGDEFLAGGTKTPGQAIVGNTKDEHELDCIVTSLCEIDDEKMKAKNHENDLRRIEVEEENVLVKNPFVVQSALFDDADSSTLELTNFEMKIKNILKETKHTSQDDFVSSYHENEQSFAGTIKATITTNRKAVKDAKELDEPDRKLISVQTRHDQKSDAKVRLKSLLKQLRLIAPEVYQLLTMETTSDMTDSRGKISHP